MADEPKARRGTEGHYQECREEKVGKHHMQSKPARGSESKKEKQRKKKRERK